MADAKKQVGAAEIGESFQREMGFSHVEFRRALQRTYTGAGLAMRDDGADIRVADGKVQIRMGPEGVRRIALLELPATMIYFKFDNVDGVQRAEF
ncbi:MAG: hypothetical protein OET44_12285, partial [Gammaproteobacteria bacterium]|nr:hypothetical protein [Gammaproteobacteria bacterium]